MNTKQKHPGYEANKSAKTAVPGSRTAIFADLPQLIIMLSQTGQIIIKLIPLSMELLHLIAVYDCPDASKSL